MRPPAIAGHHRKMTTRPTPMAFLDQQILLPRRLPSHQFVTMLATATLTLMLLIRPAHGRDVALLDCSCTRAFHPVCGSDQQTYDSACFLDCARRYDRELHQAYEGVCCPRAELCADYSDPVCDQLGTFYQNDCLFDFHKCVQRRAKGLLLRVEGRGEQMCKRPEPMASSRPMESRPIAAGVPIGQNQRQHQQHQRQRGSSDEARSRCEFFCEETVSPICDSQGRTHKNRCKFDLASCRLRSRGIVSALHVVREGACRGEDDRFGHFQAASSMRRMSLANLMEGIRRDRARKRLQLPTSSRASSAEHLVEPNPATKSSGSGEEEKGRRRSGEEEEEEEVPQIPASKLFRDQQHTSGPSRPQEAEFSRWQLTQFQTRPMPSEATTTTALPRTAPPRHPPPPRLRQQESSTTNGDCPPASECPPELWDPLCDTHNRSHANECRFSIARCEFARSASGSEQPPRIAYRGKCTGTSSRAHRPALECDFCRDEGPFDQIVPVCDNTNLTHQSVCLFAQWNCDKRLRGVEEHVLAHVGECTPISPSFELKEEVCPTKCSRHFKPVCDSNGLTHPNLCAYQMHTVTNGERRPFGWLLALRECGNQTTNKPQMDNAAGKVQLSSSESSSKEKSFPVIARSAANIECPEEANCAEQPLAEGDGPICDNEGRVHKNSCLFAHAHCLAAKAGKALRIVEDTNCPQLATLRPVERPRPMEEQKPSEQPRPSSGSGVDKSVAEACERRWPNCAEAPPDPYCGSDFITYRNFCAVQKVQCMDSRVEILFKGECEQCLSEPCPQPPPIADDSLFVCDQSGETKTRCEFQMLRCIYEAKFGYNITAAYEGRCCPNTESCSNVQHGAGNDLHHGTAAEPICDSQGRRHANRCLFQMVKCRSEKIAKQRLEERKCATTDEPLRTMMTTMMRTRPTTTESPTESPRTSTTTERSTTERSKPAEQSKERPSSSGTDGVEAYGGQREETGQMPAKALETKAMEEMPPPLHNVSTQLLSVDKIVCSDKYEPVCASDGRTYRNRCQLERRNVSSTREWASVRALYSGECCPTSEECGPEYAPVCDSEGNTHLNLCEFGRQRCLAERTRAQNVTITAYALCPGLHCPSDRCPSVYEPVCATNGRTYANLCELDKSVCVLRSGNRRTLGEGRSNSSGEAAVGTMGSTGNNDGTLALDYIGECCATAVDCSAASSQANPLNPVPPGEQPPVCDNLGRLYRDQCTFLKAACLARKREGQTLRPVQCTSIERRRKRRKRQEEQEHWGRRRR